MEQKSDLSPLMLKDAIAIITNDDEKSLRHFIKIINQNGGIIYINTPIINIIKISKLELTDIHNGGIIGLKQSNNEYPIIDFKNSRDKKEGKGIRAINITGSNKFLKYLIYNIQVVAAFILKVIIIF